MVHHIFCVWIYSVQLSGQSYFPSLRVFAEWHTGACVLPTAVTSLEVVVEAVGLGEVPREGQKRVHMGAKRGPRAAVLKLLNLGTPLHF